MMITFSNILPTTFFMENNKIYWIILKLSSNFLIPFTGRLYKNSAEVDIAPAFGEITTACNVGQAKNGSWCLLEE